MRNQDDYLKDLTVIRSVLIKSTRYFSLSGLSGILIGTYALLGAFLVHKYGNSSIFSQLEIRSLQSNNLHFTFIIASTVLTLSLLTTYLLSRKKAKKNGNELWNPIAKKLVLDALIPLVSGGILILIIINYKLIGLIIPLSLIFYGLALINMSKYSFTELRLMGVIEILFGLVAIYYLNYSLIIWCSGFGVLHIIYGYFMYKRHEK